ncbi:MAG: EF-hand domain-containing protein [Sphingobium sp.]|nr:EF-hand domain-containing protein [Sphingobium sp.]
MFHILTTSAALAFALGSAVPAMAQDIQAESPAQAGTAQTTTQAAPADQAGATNAASQVTAIINSEFPTYDGDGSGDLNKAEFSKWMLALKQQELQTTGATLSPAELTQWADAAFATADTDKSGTVSKEELTRYLGG